MIFAGSLLASGNIIEAKAVGGSGYAPYQVVNGGFETGNLTGWRTFGIWNNQSGVVAFHDNGDTNNSRELVTSANYFSNNPYNRDGNYNIGITHEDSTNWAQNDEHMGYLRSGDFTLGGSGWISFKLGGGQSSDFAYVSIRQSADDKEVARFGNRFFRSTSQATTEYNADGHSGTISNAEAFLFKYYFHLSSAVGSGTKLYITLAMTSGDSTGNSWSILSADSFVTYYQNDPGITDPNYLATNIVPSIINASTPSVGSIPGGNLDNSTDFANWSNVNGTWKIDSSRARSDVNGNGDLNVLRSTAFQTTNTNNCLQFDWNGGLKYDKQIFLSIKEVGTNIEKIRATRRADKSDYASDGHDDALVDLTGLDTSKVYYLEFADNAMGDWGISMVDNVKLISSSAYNGITSGDRCVIVTGIPTSFPYSDQQEAICWSQSFLDTTGTYCAALNGGTMAGDNTWASLATSYGTLTSAAMADFKTIPSDSTQSPTNILLHNPPIQPAEARYQFLIVKYSTLAATNFMVDGTGVVIISTSGASTAGNLNTTPDNSVLFIFSFVAISAVIGATIFLIRKNKKEI
jgi:hypothetical protein